MKRSFVLILALLGFPAWSGQNLPNDSAEIWLQRMADAARQLPYEGVFVFGHGDRMQTLQVINQPSGGGKVSRLWMLDGQQREVRCQRNRSVSVLGQGGALRMERRLGNRHFPDLLPENAAALAAWYGVRLGDEARVGGMGCRLVELIPKDRYRWGYTLCVENRNYLPLKAVMVNEAGQPLLQYSFAEIRIGANGNVAAAGAPDIPAEMPRPADPEAIEVKQLPPGYTRVAAGKRRLPVLASEVEHWVYSDGLNIVSLFIEPATRPVAGLKGASPRGMMNLLTRQVGDYQVTVVGDVPWTTVESIAMNLAEARSR